MVYFMQPIDGGPVKIGTSENLDARLKQLEAHYGCPLAVLATLPGSYEEEAEIHRRFGRTEQFRPSPELMAFIGRPLLVGPNPEAVEALESTSGQVSILTLKGTEAYKAWLANESKETSIASAKIVRLGLKLWAKQNGRTAPPEI